MPTDKMRLDMEWDFSLAEVVVETKRVKGFVLLKQCRKFFCGENLCRWNSRNLHQRKRIAVK